MELQNIRVDFLNNELMSRFEDKIYTLDFNAISSLPALKIEFETLFNLTIEHAVISLTESEYGVGAEPRIYTSFGEDGYNFTNLTTIVTEQPTFYAALQATRVEIEAEITNQITPAE
jgi:hypothetical protein